MFLRLITRLLAIPPSEKIRVKTHKLNEKLG
jgi:hypothetical protein